MSKTLSQLPVGALVVDSNTTYYGSPIVWMKLEDDHDGVGNTTLITEEIISFKCFDAKEPNNSNSSRRSNGNNRYSVSNIHQWLNSDAAAGEWYSAQHSADAPPNSSNVYQQSGTAIGSYDTEAGFMNGFSEDFKSVLQSIPKTVVLNTVTDGGGSETVIDKIFLLSITEVGLGNENDIAEGTQYTYFADNTSRISTCTAEAISNVAAYSGKPSVNTNWKWWLRTPNATSSYIVRGINSSGALGSDNPFYGNDYSVRPACAILSSTKVSDSPNADGYYILEYNFAPDLILSSYSLGIVSSFPTDFTYTVSDEDNDLSSFTVSLDDVFYTTIDLSQITQGEPTSFILDSEVFAGLTESIHTLTFTATDTYGKVTIDTCIFKKKGIPQPLHPNNRLVTRDDAARIISALHGIANRIGKRFNKPTLSINSIPYDGETHQIMEILEGFDSDYMLLTGDIEVSEEGVYNAFVQLKRERDKWSDETDGVFQIIWGYGRPYAGITWSNGTDEEIYDMIAAADRGEIDLTDYWEVGDIRKVNLNAMSGYVTDSHVAQTVEMVLVAKDTGIQDFSNPCYNYQYTTATSGRTYPSFIVQQKNLLADDVTLESGPINASTSATIYWGNCQRREWCNYVYRYAFLGLFRDIFKQVQVKTVNYYDGSVVSKYSDYFFLPAEKEVFGSVTRSITAEADALSIWQYYEVSANRIKKAGTLGSESNWWMRSLGSRSSNSFFCYVNNDNSASASYYANYGIAPAGCI